MHQRDPRRNGGEVRRYSGDNSNWTLTLRGVPEADVQKTVASWRKGVAGCRLVDGNVSLDAELLDIPGLVVGNPGAVIGLAMFSFLSVVRQPMRAGL